jgi:polysaccharide export outer membrane protein
MNRSFALILAAAAAAFSLSLPLRAEKKSDANYHLFPRDLIRVAVFGEPDMSVERRIDGDGRITLPLIGPVLVRNLTVTEAEDQIRDLYLSRHYFVHPQVTLSVVAYSPKEVSVVGQVKNPGAVTFPMEADSLPVVDVISRVGGFTRIGRAESVHVTRTGPDGTRQVYTINVKGMLDGRARVAPFMVQPGDVIFVPETVF